MNEELNRIELTLEEAEAKVTKADKWQKLLGNPLFDELVTRDYLGDDAVRLTMNIRPKAEDNEIVNTMLASKAMFSRFVSNVLEEGNQAMSTIEENRALRSEIDGE